MKIIITEYMYNAVEIMNIKIHASVKLPFQGSRKRQAQDKAERGNLGTTFLVTIEKLL